MTEKRILQYIHTQTPLPIEKTNEYKEKVDK